MLKAELSNTSEFCGESQKPTLGNFCNQAVAHLTQRDMVAKTLAAGPQHRTLLSRGDGVLIKAIYSSPEHTAGLRSGLSYSLMWSFNLFSPTNMSGSDSAVSRLGP